MAVVELDIDFQGLAVAAFCLLEASVLMGDIAELVVDPGGFVSVVELDFDLKGRSVMGFCLPEESLLLSEARANQRQRLVPPCRRARSRRRRAFARSGGRRGRLPPEGRALDEVSRASSKAARRPAYSHDGAGRLNDRVPRDRSRALCQSSSNRRFDGPTV